MRAIWVVPLVAAGCGGGTNDTYVNLGGTLAIPGCGYSITTKQGAEEPELGDATIGSDPTPRLVHLGIVGDPKTSIVAQWRTADETTAASELRYAVGANLTADQLTQKVAGIEFRYAGTAAPIFRQHQAHVCGLQPGTTYSYEVGTSGHFSPVYTFHTAPDVGAHPDAEVVLGFVGDSRGGQDVWAQLVTQLQARTPDLMLFSGDAVLVGITQDEWELFLANSEAMIATIPIVLTNGNHEANAINYYAQFAMPGDQENFGFDYGFAHVTVGNDTPEDAATLTTTTLDAIHADFDASAAARWKLLMHHQPMWSSGTKHGSNLTLQASWGPIVDQYHIDLVLNGHEHSYEVTEPLVGGLVQPTNANATVYVVAGGAGADLYPVGTSAFTAYSEMSHSSSVIHVRRDQLTLDSFHPDGTPIATGFTKTKP